MDISLATPERIIFSGLGEDLVVTADKGQLQILDRHANLITLVHPGSLKIHSAGAEKKFEVSEGVLKIEDNQVSVLCSEIKPS